jgi:hypothetical protein
MKQQLLMGMLVLVSASPSLHAEQAATIADMLGSFNAQYIAPYVQGLPSLAQQYAALRKGVVHAQWIAQHPGAQHFITTHFDTLAGAVSAFCIVIVGMALWKAMYRWHQAGTATAQSAATSDCSQKSIEVTRSNALPPCDPDMLRMYILPENGVLPVLNIINCDLEADEHQTSLLHGNLFTQILQQASLDYEYEVRVNDTRRGTVRLKLRDRLPWKCLGCDVAIDLWPPAHGRPWAYVCRIFNAEKDQVVQDWQRKIVPQLLSLYTDAPRPVALEFDPVAQTYMKQKKGKLVFMGLDGKERVILALPQQPARVDTMSPDDEDHDYFCCDIQSAPSPIAQIADDEYATGLQSTSSAPALLMHTR